MFLELLVFLFLGVIIGILTGLIPGLHPNTILIITLSFSVFLTHFSLPAILTFVISMSVCNTFTNFIPSILFGAPDPESCLSVLPGHRMLMVGRGYEALFFTVVGGVGVTVLTILTLPLLFLIIPAAYLLIHPYLYVILIFIVIWMFISDRSWFSALIVFSLSGIFGFISLNGLPSEMVLFPALTGLFGLSSLIVSAMNKTTIPHQQEPSEMRESHLKGTVAGWLAGMLTGLLPGIGASQAGVIVAQTFKSKTKDFLTALGGINTSNIFFTFIVFYAIGKTRSGAAWALSQLMDIITLNDIILLMIIGAISCFISAIITLKIGRLLIRSLDSFNYARINIFIIFLMIILVFVFSGPMGLLVLFIGTCIGLFAIMSGTRRTHMMGFLIFPTILYFSGISAFLMMLIGM